MLHAYISIKSAKIILTILLLGSISGFVLGQELHQPFAPVAHTTSVVQVSATGSLGTVSTTTAHKVTVALHTTPPGHTAHPSPPEMPSPSKHRHHKDKDGMSSSAYSTDSFPIHQDSGGHGDHGGGNSQGGD